MLNNKFDILNSNYDFNIFDRISKILKQLEPLIN